MLNLSSNVLTGNGGIEGWTAAGIFMSRNNAVAVFYVQSLTNKPGEPSPKGGDVARRV
jgi:hypothetical protein